MAEQKKQDTNQLLKVRREKLADLQANGKDPFQITKFDQTHHSLEVKNLYEAHEAEILKRPQDSRCRRSWMKHRQEKSSKRIMKREEKSWMQSPIHVCDRRPYDVQACHGKSFFL